MLTKTSEQIGLTHNGRGVKKVLLSAVLAVALGAAIPMSPAHANSDTLSRLINAKPSAKRVDISPVRAAALRSTAQALGTQSGLVEYAKKIMAVIDERRIEMEQQFRFGDMVIGAGVLPPVILKTENAVAVQGDSMRLAGSVYKLHQPARFFSGAPSWRDWLLMGLPVEEDMPDIPVSEQLLPRNAKEREFWKQEIQEAYLSGQKQAQEIFENNLSELEQTYLGMRTFYELYQRNMVSAPTIAKSQEIITQDDPHTIILGDTLFRITQPSEFKINPSAWKALKANPAQIKKLPVVFNYDPEQVKHAYKVAEEIKQRNEEREKRKRSLFSRASAQEESAPAPLAPTVQEVVPEPAQVGIVAPVGQTTVRTITVRSAPDQGVASNQGVEPAVISPSRPLFQVPTR